MIIRLDAIGDYVLFRNFLLELRSSKRYKGKRVTLVGNLAWKDLTMELDAEVVDEFIWLDRKKFSNNLFYRYRKLKKIRSSSYEEVISPVYSREFFYSDWIVNCVDAEEKIGSTGDYSNITVEQKNISDKWFTKLIPAKEEVMFEFERNKEFFEVLLEKRLPIIKPALSLPLKKQKFNLPGKYVVLFIGAGAAYRKWPIENFAAIAKLWKEKYGFNIVLCGGADDADDAEMFAKYFEGEFADLIGKTNLVELMNVIKNADVLVSNETSAPHFGVALNNKALFVISNGNHYGRFTPYPYEMSHAYHVIYHPELGRNCSDDALHCKKYGNGSELDISEVSVEAVVSKISLVMG